MHLSSGMNRQVSDDILQHILGCVYDNSSDQLSPVFVNNSCEPVPGDIRISTDIDSFAYVSSDLPLKHSCTLDIRPPYSSSYTTDTGVAWSHERYTNDVKVGVHKISNVQFLHSERLQVLFFFLKKRILKKVARLPFSSLEFIVKWFRQKVHAHHTLYLFFIMKGSSIWSFSLLWILSLIRQLYQYL